MGSHSLLQGIFPTQGLNLGLPHCRQIILIYRGGKVLSRNGENWFSVTGKLRQSWSWNSQVEVSNSAIQTVSSPVHFPLTAEPPRTSIPLPISAGPFERWGPCPWSMPSIPESAYPQPGIYSGSTEPAAGLLAPHIMGIRIH